MQPNKDTNKINLQGSSQFITTSYTLVLLINSKTEFEKRSLFKMDWLLAKRHLISKAFFLNDFFGGRQRLVASGLGSIEFSGKSSRFFLEKP